MVLEGKFKNGGVPNCLGQIYYRFPIDPSQKMRAIQPWGSFWLGTTCFGTCTCANPQCGENGTRNLAWWIRYRMSCTVSLLQISLDICTVNQDSGCPFALSRPVIAGSDSEKDQHPKGPSETLGRAANTASDKWSNGVVALTKFEERKSMYSNPQKRTVIRCLGLHQWEFTCLFGWGSYSVMRGCWFETGASEWLFGN